MVLELETVANDLIKSKMQCDGPDLEVQRARHKNVAVTEIARRIDQCLGLGKDRRLERHFEEVVGKADEPVAMHPPISSKRENVEKRPRVEIEPEEQRHA